MVSPVTGEAAYSNDPATWTSFNNALEYMEAHNMDGITFALNSEIVFIDFDHAVDPITKEIKSETAKAVMAELPATFAEYSTSGDGLHILCYGNLPENARKRNDKLGIEMYESKRFCCFTGNTVKGRVILIDYSDRIEKINRKYVGENVKPKEQRRYSVSSLSNSDDKLIARILRSRQADKFQSLYSGSTAMYESHSQADAAFVWLLAFWTRDRIQIDRIFRSGGLYRDKWDRRLYSTTYGESIIDSALASVRAHREIEAGG